MRSSADIHGTHLTAARPGSALIIVIGTLALISVFAAIYISVGQNDRRSATTVRERTNLDEITSAYADHIARTIAADRLDVMLQPIDAQRQYYAPRRITTDAPYTDWSMRSESNDSWRLFNHVGGNPFPLPRSFQGEDPRVASDPWLASTRPTYLGDPLQRVLSQNNPARAYLDNRDLYQISNVAPDGRHVNLFNLRGNFRAEPGRGTSQGGARRLSEGLTLYRLRNPNSPTSPVQSFDPFQTATAWVPGLNQPGAIPGLTPEDFRNTPAMFTMFQRFAHLPADPSFVTYNRQNQVSSWADQDFPLYQWADADGDGMLDSRWFELTAARTPAPSGSNRNDIQRFYDDSEYRVFAAVRIVDLSSMVNVNTATDALTPPTEDFPFGLTPAEVDLRRLLTMQDAAADYNTTRQAGLLPLSFADLHQPRNIQGTGTQPAFRIESDYTNHEHIAAQPNPRLLDPQSSAMLTGRYAAAALRRGMERHTTLGPEYRGTFSQFVNTADPFLLPEGSTFQRSGYNPTEKFNYYAGGRAEAYMRVGRVDPTRMGRLGSVAYATGTTQGISNSDYFDAAVDTLPFHPYGLDDLAELLTYHGLNDPDNTTRLERNALGRFDGTEGEERLSPLLSTRTLDLDRFRHGQMRSPPADPNPRRPRQVTGEISPETLALTELSPRTVLTPLSGATSLRPLSVVGGPVRAPGGQVANPTAASFRGLETSEAGITLFDVANTAGLAANANKPFSLFYQALAGELEMYRIKRSGGQDGPAPTIINDIWRADLALNRTSPYATLFYAHRGPELAMRIAAHAAVNLRDTYDNDRTPTVASLILHNEFGDSPAYRTLLNTLANNPNSFNLTAVNPQAQLALFYPGLMRGATRFDIDAENLGNSTTRRDQAEWVLPAQNQNPRPPAERQAVNVIGVEPMPIITEVASFYVYTDASQNAGGDGDSTNYQLPPNPGRPVPITIAQATIDGTRSELNTDFLAGVIAFQLHNPFDVAITLGSGTGPNGVMWRKNDSTGSPDNFNNQNNFEFDYYLEYNGWFFKLGEFWEFTPANDVPAGFSPEQRTTISNAGGTAPPADQRLDPAFQEFQYRNVTIPAGGTQVFYAMFHPRFDWVDRVSLNSLENTWFRVVDAYGNVRDEFISSDPAFDADEDGRPDGFDRRGWTGLAQEWIERQLAVPVNVGGSGDLRAAARVHPFDPRTGELVRQGQFTDFIEQPADAFGVNLPGRIADNKQVRLWRKHVVANYEEATTSSLADFPSGTRRNLVQNDILADRLFLARETESVNYLSVGLPQSRIEINGTVSFRESDQILTECGDIGLVVRNDNSGLSITRWASVRRREAPSSLDDGDAVGRMLPWMVQSRRDPASTWARATNFAGRPDAVPEAFSNSLTWETFFDDCPGGGDPANPATPLVRKQGADRYDIAYTPMELFDDGLFRRGSRVATMGLNPFEKSTEDPTADEGQRFDRVRLGANPFGDSLFGSATSLLRPEVVLGKSANATRIGDALMTMGIGPTWAPIVRNLNDHRVEDREWMTLPEALAVALGYETFNLAAPGENAAANAVWYDAVRTVVGQTEAEYVLDNLHLRTDDYVAFINVINQDETGPNQKPVYSSNPTSPNVSDFRRGTGAPIALGVIDQLRPFGVLPLPGDPSRSSPDAEERLAAERLVLTRPLMGTINVQTAPLRVLRLLPGLTPSAEFYAPDETSPTNRRPEWWGAASGLATDTGVATLNPADPRENPDIAAGIVAYRDRLFATPRSRSTDPALAPLTFQPDPALNAQFIAQNLKSEFALNPSFPVDRAGVSGIPGLRGTPMFSSLGELLAVAVNERNTSNPQLANDRRHLTMQAYFGNTRNLGVDGDNENAVSIDPKFFNARSGVTPDDYAERLAVASGIMNIATVRSDYFAAWMVIQGFRESDVNGLRPEDPLVPSFQRRFIMVIDRSNVVEPGDAPRIVLFREVPL